MSWLLDTHVWIWSQLEPERLGPETAALLQDPLQTLHVATISTLEIARLTHRGRLELRLSVEDWVEASLDALRAVTVGLCDGVAVESYRLPDPFPRDPADRILVATARSQALCVITADQRILRYPHVRSHDAAR